MKYLVMTVVGVLVGVAIWRVIAGAGQRATGEPGVGSSRLDGRREDLGETAADAIAAAAGEIAGAAVGPGDQADGDSPGA